MKFLRRARPAALMLSTGASLATAGTISSSGGEFLSTQLNPWFVGRPSFSVCIGRTIGSSVDPQALKGAVSRAFGRWHEAFNRIPQFGASTSPDDPGTFLTTRAQVRERCLGGEDVTIEIGTKADAFDGKNTKGTPRFLSFAERTWSSDDQKWSRGRIWIRSDEPEPESPAGAPPAWSVPGVLDQVLLHEIGHIHGVQHASGGVMSEFLPFAAYRHALELDPAARHEAGQQGWKAIGPERFAALNLDTSEQPACGPVGAGRLRGRKADDLDVFLKALFPSLPNLPADARLCVTAHLGLRKPRNTPRAIPRAGQRKMEITLIGKSGDMLAPRAVLQVADEQPPAKGGDSLVLGLYPTGVGRMGSRLEPRFFATLPAHSISLMPGPLPGDEVVFTAKNGSNWWGFPGQFTFVRDGRIAEVEWTIED